MRICPKCGYRMDEGKPPTGRFKIVAQCVKCHDWFTNRDKNSWRGLGWKLRNHWEKVHGFRPPIAKATYGRG